MSLLKINYTNCFNKKNKTLFEELINSKDNQSKINNIINNSEFLKIINNYNEIENIKLSSDKFSKYLYLRYWWIKSWSSSFNRNFT